MDQLLDIDLTNLIPDPSQPRKDFNQQRLEDLAGSIAAVGVKTPISVRLNIGAMPNEPQYMIIAGERRWRASMMAGKKTVPCVFVQDEESLTGDALFKHQLIENLDREDLNPVEKAEFLNERMEYLRGQGITNVTEHLAAEIGKSPAWVSINTAILKFKEEVRALARNGKLRDYAILKKLNALEPAKQAKAISLIQTGDFNAKDFFSRKRYDKKIKVVATETSDQAEQGTDTVKSPKEQKIALQFNSEDFIKLVDRTDFKSVLDSTDPAWRSGSAAILKAYAGKFKEWIVSEV